VVGAPSRDEEIGLFTLVGPFVEKEVPRLKEPFFISPISLGSFQSIPNRMNNELAVWTRSALVDDHFGPSGLEVYVLSDPEHRRGG
jgi:hypothetical protein